MSKKRTPKQRIIYSNFYGWISDEDLTQSVLETDECNNHEIYGAYSEEDVDDDMRLKEMYDLEQVYWDDEKANIECWLDKLPNSTTFLVFGSNGRWNGTYSGWETGEDLYEIIYDLLKDCESAKLYDENGEFHVMGIHHDGTNHAVIRMLTEAGKEYLWNWENSYTTKRTSRHVGRMLAENTKYSQRLHVMHNVYGTPKIQWAK